MIRGQCASTPTTAVIPLRLEKPVLLDASNVFHDPANPEQKNGKQCIEVATELDELVALGDTELGLLFSGRRVSAEVLTRPGVRLPR